MAEIRTGECRECGASLEMLRNSAGRWVMTGHSTPETKGTPAPIMCGGSYERPRYLHG